MILSSSFKGLGIMVLVLSLTLSACSQGSGEDNGQDTVAQVDTRPEVGEDTLEAVDTQLPDTTPDPDTLTPDTAEDTLPDTLGPDTIFVGDDLCPDDMACRTIMAGGAAACMVGGTELPPAMTNCHQEGIDCFGNTSCKYTNEEKTESICVMNCGECTGGLTCADVTGDGYLGCLSNGSIPSNAVTGCHENGGCTGNATCFYTSSDYTESVCINNCSPCKEGTCGEGLICGSEGLCVPKPCEDGDCEDDEICDQESGKCVPAPCTANSCDPGMICANGTCIPDPGEGPGPGPGPSCADLPPLTCEGSASYCGELIRFNPTEADGYIDYPENGETEANQYRSWLRRDAVMVIQYAAAKVACKAKDWEFGNGGPVGLIDMSEQNGAIPGTSVGSPGHPDGTHTNGRDIDLAYFQTGTANNRARPICNHYDANYAEAYHCTSAPDKLDPWRQALFIAALYEYPSLRVIGCDGQAGPIIEEAFDTLCDLGWISQSICYKNKLTYEVTNQGYGWYYFHHHHIHVSFNAPTYNKPGEQLLPELADGPLCLTPDCGLESIKAFNQAHGLSARPELIPVSRVKQLF